MNKNKITKFKSKLIKDEINQRIFCDRYQLSYSIFRGAINSCKGFRMKSEFEKAVNNYLADIKPRIMPWIEAKEIIKADGIKFKKTTGVLLISHEDENVIYDFLQYLSKKDISENKFKVMPFRSDNYQHEWYLAIVAASKYKKLFSDVYLDYLAEQEEKNVRNNATKSPAME